MRYLANAQSGLTIGTTSGLDLTDNTFIINYGSGLDPNGMIAGYLTTGYNNNTNAWGGSLGIISTTVSGLNTNTLVNVNSLTYAVGYADGSDGVSKVPGLSSGQIEIMPTLAGDATLQGIVNFGDFQVFAANYGKPAGWDGGNFVYATFVNFGDFEIISDNIGKNDSLLFS